MSAGKKRGRDGDNDNDEVKQPDKKRARTQKREIPPVPFEFALRTGELYPMLHSQLKQLNQKQVFSIASRFCDTKAPVAFSFNSWPTCAEHGSPTAMTKRTSR